MSRSTNVIRSSLPLLLLLCSACLAPKWIEFTAETRRLHKLTDDELTRIQFYNSNEIILTGVQEERQAPTRRKQRLDTRLLDRVVIKRRTPGLAMAVGGNWIDISFEEGRSLHFTQLPSGRFKLTSTIVTYGGRRYHVECVPHRSSDCPVSLLIRRELDPKTRIQRQKVRGRKLP
ncbi:MAG: hypothetical protein JSW54_07145 [Fidelibacterota bacterium]|nr:MAG: hypothetical protein JSW54_07145 [Candidatus Neomarinimicrobiota bacterium]